MGGRGCGRECWLGSERLGHISIYCSVAILRELEDALENVVGGFVGTASLPPALDDSPVVPIDNNVIALV